MIQKVQSGIADRSNLLFLCLFLLSGMTFDFIFVGILKVAWFIVYGTTYVTLALTLEAFISNSKHKRFSKTAVISFLVGTALGHLCLVGQHRQDIYSMTLVAADPIQLKSPDFPDVLFLTSANLSQALAQDHRHDGIPMLTEVISDYGCARTFVIVSVDHVKIQDDPSATWTFRASELGVYQGSTQALGEEKEWLWCKIQFYRPALKNANPKI